MRLVAALGDDALQAHAAGCTEAQIASITGHSLSDVHSILDAHYLHRDPELARAVDKLERCLMQ